MRRPHRGVANTVTGGGGLYPGTDAVFSCDEGYYVVGGNSTVQCGTDGTYAARSCSQFDAQCVQPYVSLTHAPTLAVQCTHSCSVIACAICCKCTHDQKGNSYTVVPTLKLNQTEPLKQPARVMRDQLPDGSHSAGWCRGSQYRFSTEIADRRRHSLPTCSGWRENRLHTGDIRRAIRSPMNGGYASIHWHIDHSHIF